jgi:hypothetical protein
VQARAFSSARNKFQQQSDSSSSSSDAVAAALVAAVAGGALYSSCDTKATFSIPQLTTARTEPRRFMSMNQPRNVMLHRMRSKAGRGLNDKYSVDWKTILGEGAYGSVHPARLACTGEKVSLVIR